MVDTMIRLFAATEVTFQSNGLGSLPDALKCEVTEEQNGSYELELQYHISGMRYTELKLRRMIVAKPNPYDEPQPFRIYEISKPLNGIVTVKAEHISYDMSGYPVSPFAVSDVTAALTDLKSNSIVECPFQFSTDMSGGGEFAVLKPASMRSLLGGSDHSILDTYGGELEFDRFRVLLHAHRGADRGVTIRYGKNMTDLKQEENCSNVYTGVYPFWYSEEWGLIDLPEKTVSAPGIYDFTRVYPLDLSGDWENTYEWEDQYPSEDEIRDLANQYISDHNIGTPAVSLTVSFEQLVQSKEYETLALLETVHLCDDVHVEFPELGVSAVSKCIKTTYNVLTGKYVSIELGEAKSNLASAIASKDSAVDKKLNERPTKSFMEKAVENATQLISGGLGGYVVLHDSRGGKYPDEILIMDTDDIGTAKKVWRWNKGGLGYSDKGYHGPYATAITQEGEIVADFVKTGHLSASMIQGGTLAVGGIDNANGTIEIRDAKNNLLIKLDVNGISFSGDGKNPVTKIIKDTVTTAFVNALKITAEHVEAEKITGTTISGKSLKGNTVVAGGTDDGVIEVRDADNTLLLKLSTKGLQFFDSGANPVTQIIKDTVTTAFVNALKITAEHVAAENITGTTISGKKISGCTIDSVSADGRYRSYMSGGISYSTVLYLYEPPGEGVVAGIAKLNETQTAVTNQMRVYDKETVFSKPVYIAKNAGGSATVYPSVGMLTNGRIYSDGAVCPDDTDCEHPLGTADYKWKVVHAKNGEINTSDRNEKHDIKPIAEVYEELFFRLKPVSFLFNDGDRTHLGIISQDLEESMKELGLSDLDVAAFCRDIKMKAVVDESTGEAVEVPDLDEAGELQYRYGVRKPEFILLNTHMIQKAYQRLERLEAQLEEILPYIKGV